MSTKLFLLSQLQYIINIDTRKLFYNAHIKPHIAYASVMWDGCGEVHFKKLNSLHRSAGKLILPGPFPSTEQRMSALGILNLPQQLAYNKGIFMHKVLNNNSPNYLAQLFISNQSHYTNSRNNLYVPRPRLDLFKTSISFAGASLWNSLPQNVKSCISLSCFKRNLHKYMSENNLLSNLDGFVWITRLPKNLSVVYMYAIERNLILMFLHICRNCETALISCLIMVIIFVRGIVVLICICSIARTGC